MSMTQRRTPMAHTSSLGSSYRALCCVCSAAQVGVGHAHSYTVCKDRPHAYRHAHHAHVAWLAAWQHDMACGWHAQQAGKQAGRQAGRHTGGQSQSPKAHTGARPLKPQPTPHSLMTGGLSVLSIVLSSLRLLSATHPQSLPTLNPTLNPALNPALNPMP